MHPAKPPVVPDAHPATVPAGPPARPGARPAESAIASPPRLDSRSLFGDAREVEIEHRSQLYRLRRTALGKLILTK